MVWLKRIRYTGDAGVNIFGKDDTGRDIPARVKWVNAHGTDVSATIQQELREGATITMRYHPDIAPGLLVYKLGSDRPYKVISVDNVEERCRWMELKVQRELLAMDKTTLLTLEVPRYRTDALLQRVPDGVQTREVRCSVKNITGTEQTDAPVRGLKAALCVTVWAADYCGEPVAVLEGERYGICRTSQPNAGEVELYLERKAGVSLSPGSTGG